MDLEGESESESESEESESDCELESEAEDDDDDDDADEGEADEEDEDEDEDEDEAAEEDTEGDPFLTPRTKRRSLPGCVWAVPVTLSSFLPLTPKLEVSALISQSSILSCERFIVARGWVGIGEM